MFLLRNTNHLPPTLCPATCPPQNHCRLSTHTRGHHPHTDYCNLTCPFLDMPSGPLKWHYAWPKWMASQAMNYRKTVKEEAEKVHSFISSVSVDISREKSFWKLHRVWSVQNFKTISQMSTKLWANEISGDLSLSCVSDGYPILQQPLRPLLLTWFNFNPVMDK